MLAGFNSPLGFDAAEPFQELVVPFEEGDIFVFYSDGVTEARNPAGVLFGEQQVAKLVRENCGLNATALVELIGRQVNDYAAAEGVGDDVTLVAVRIMPLPHDACSAKPGDRAHEER